MRSSTPARRSKASKASRRARTSSMSSSTGAEAAGSRSASAPAQAASARRSAVGSRPSARGERGRDGEVARVGALREAGEELRAQRRAPSPRPAPLPRRPPRRRPQAALRQQRLGQRHARRSGRRLGGDDLAQHALGLDDGAGLVDRDGDRKRTDGARSPPERASTSPSTSATGRPWRSSTPASASTLGGKPGLKASERRSSASAPGRSPASTRIAASDSAARCVPRPTCRSRRSTRRRLEALLEQRDGARLVARHAAVWACS